MYINVGPPSERPQLTGASDVTLSEGSHLNQTISIVDSDSSMWQVSVTDARNHTRQFNTPDNQFQLDRKYADDGTDLVTVEVCDEAGVCANTSINVTVTNANPEITPSIPASVLEGHNVTVSAIVTDPGVADTIDATVRWQNTSEPRRLANAASVPSNLSASHVYADDGEYRVTLTATDDDGGATSVSRVVTVENAPPTVDAAGDTITEGQNATVTAEFSDPGMSDTHSATVDWGDGATTEVSLSNTSSTQSFSAAHTYGDDGTYNVTVAVTDDDGGTGTDVVPVTVSNAALNVSLVANPMVAFPSGKTATVTSVGGQVSLSATATDPGSDDLTVRWTPTESQTYWNDGSSPDPDHSPGGTFPVEVTDSYSTTPASASMGSLSVTVLDDDGGTATASVQQITKGDATTTRGIGFWRHQFKQPDKSQYETAELRTYREIVTFGSTVFSEQTDISEVEAAYDALLTRGPSMRSKVTAQLFAAWLNYAAGAVEWNETIDIDGDGQGDRTVGELLSDAESILTDEEASRSDLETAKSLAEAINTPSASSDETHGNGNSGGNGHGN